MSKISIFRNIIWAPEGLKKNYYIFVFKFQFEWSTLVHIAVSGYMKKHMTSKLSKKLIPSSHEEGTEDSSVTYGIILRGQVILRLPT